MPWKNVSPKEEKLRFVNLAQSDRYTVSELCEEFGISRKTGHKWLARHSEEGEKGLEERSRAPKSVAQRTGGDVERLIVAERRLHPTWGAKKIRAVLESKHGMSSPPATSTVGAVLKRNGLIETRRRRPGRFKVQREELTDAERPNHVFAVDFKGWFNTGDGERFDPLTVTDLHSRYLLRAEGLPQATTRWTQGAFRALFRRSGLPEIIRVDNGAPFASMGPGGLSKLSVWWIGLGIRVEFTRPGCPQDNGSHERMHRTMKAECCKPPSVNIPAQQQRVNRWRKVFNEERPHEALGMRYPAEVYQPCARRLDERVKPDLYELGVETKRVNSAGFVSMCGANHYVGESFAGVDVALETGEKDGLIHVRYANVQLGDLGSHVSPAGRLRPTASASRRAKRACKPKPKR